MHPIFSSCHHRIKKNCAILCALCRSRASIRINLSAHPQRVLLTTARAVANNTANKDLRVCTQSATVAHTSRQVQHTIVKRPQSRPQHMQRAVATVKRPQSRPKHMQRAVARPCQTQNVQKLTACSTCQHTSKQPQYICKRSGSALECTTRQLRHLGHTVRYMYQRKSKCV